MPKLPETRPIAGADGYSVSVDGLVWRLEPTLRIVPASPTPRGYLVVRIRFNGKRTTKIVHRLVAQAFLAPDPTRPEVNHIDGVKTNNHASNLEWVTSLENQRHAVAIGLHPKGSRQGSSKLVESQVLEILESLASRGLSHRQLARKYGVSNACIDQIATKRTWAWMSLA